MGISILGLSGPAFLGLYAAVATLTLVTAYLYIRVSDPTRARAPPSVPTAPDAIALAYLSGGANNVIRTILFDLRRRGFVGVTADHRLEPTRSPEPKSALDPRAARMLEALRGRPKPDDLFSDKALAADIDQLCTTERRRLHAEDLLRPAEVDSAARGAAALGSLILIGLSGAKLYVAHSEGRDNVMFLVALAFFAEMILWAIVSRAWNRAASARGTAHVRAIRRAYEAASRRRLAPARPSTRARSSWWACSAMRR